MGYHPEESSDPGYIAYGKFEIKLTKITCVQNHHHHICIVHLKHMAFPKYY